MQTSYGSRSASLIGMPANDSLRGFVYSRACESASVDFGLVVGAGSSDTQCQLGGTTPLGVAMRNPANAMDSDNDGQYLQYEAVSILDQDFVYVNTASTSGSYGDAVSYNTTTGAVVIGAPGSGENAIGWLAQTVAAAGIIKIFVDSRAEMRSVLGGISFDFTSLADDCMLRYNATNRAFECEEVDAVKIDGVDVDMTALADDCMIRYNLTNAAFECEEVDAVKVGGVDVDMTAIADDYVLRYNATNTAFECEATDGIDLDAASIKGVTVDDTDIGADKILKYNDGTGNLEYEVDAT